MTLPAYQLEWLEEIRTQAVACESRRPFTRKPTKTGTISAAAALYLRALVEWVRPTVCIEIGTFIGTSALVLAATGARVYTCDKDNAAFPSSETIIAFGKTTSTAMLTALTHEGVLADLWFFDGRIQDDDVTFIEACSSPDTVYAFDDYEGREKGVLNVEKLRRVLGLPAHRLIPPPARVWTLPERTTIAVLVPESRA